MVSFMISESCFKFGETLWIYHFILDRSLVFLGKSHRIAVLIDFEDIMSLCMKKRASHQENPKSESVYLFTNVYRDLF
ncbi:hypothetical protein Bca4012_058637 [Brassica carinata]